MDDSFYAADVTARGLCSDGFVCDGFSPSSATVKVRGEYVVEYQVEPTTTYDNAPSFNVPGIGIQQRVKPTIRALQLSLHANNPLICS